MAGSGSDSDSEINRVVFNAKRPIKWKEVEISEEDLSRDWRIRAKFKQNYGEYWDYYCAFGKKCPTKVKKKILSNGVIVISTNGLDHDNHRSIDFGLSDEQKKLILDCFASGVTDFICSCSDFFKNYVCIHAIGVANTFCQMRQLLGV